VTSQDVNEEIAMSDKKRRETLMGTNAILFLHLDDDDEDSGALERLNGLVSFHLSKNNIGILYFF
jgi:hypothetical protein